MMGNGKHDVADNTADISRELRELQRQLRSRANDVRKEVVKQLYTGAEALRREAHDTEIGDDAKKAADDLARGLEKAANYLNSRSVDDMGADATRVVRRNPMRAVIIAFGVGLLMGVMMRGGENK